MQLSQNCSVVKKNLFHVSRLQRTPQITKPLSDLGSMFSILGQYKRKYNPGQIGIFIFYLVSGMRCDRKV